MGSRGGIGAELQGYHVLCGGEIGSLPWALVNGADTVEVHGDSHVLLRASSAG